MDTQCSSKTLISRIGDRPCNSVKLQVNLLDDHLVDVLLDSAAGGWNTVEREAAPHARERKGLSVGGWSLSRPGMMSLRRL